MYSFFFSDSGLDSKYLQRSGDPPLHSSTSPNSLHFASGRINEDGRQGVGRSIDGPAYMGASKGASLPVKGHTRLSKDSIVPHTGPSQPPLVAQNPPLASSYFPTQRQSVT